MDRKQEYIDQGVPERLERAEITIDVPKTVGQLLGIEMP
jgi:hypothetical protein